MTHRNKKLFSRSGNASIFLVTLSSIVILWMIGSIHKANQYRNAKKKTEATQQTLTRSVTGLYFFREALRLINTTTTPTLYPVPYPTSLLTTPQITALGTMPTGFTLLAANDPNCPNCLEFRFPKTQDISQNTFETLFSSPQSPLSSVGLGSTPIRIRFISYTAEPPTPPATSSPNPLMVKSVVAEVSAEYTPPGSSTVQNLVNRIEVRVDAPPAPTCVITKNFATNPKPGDTVSFKLESRSIIGSAQFTGNNWTSQQNISMPANQSIATIDPTKAATNVGNFSFVAPNAASWTLDARVFSVDATKAAGNCSIVVAVDNTPPPNCTLVASPVQIATGEPSTLTLTCTGNVTSLRLGDKGAEVAVAGVAIANGLRYTGTYTLTAAQTNRTLAGFGTGAGGTSNKPEVIISKYPQCPFVSNGNYRRFILAPNGINYPLQANVFVEWGPLQFRGTRYNQYSAMMWTSSVKTPYWLLTGAPASAVYADEYDQFEGRQINNFGDAGIDGGACDPNNICMFSYKGRSPKLVDAGGNLVYFDPNTYHTFGRIAVEYGPKTDPNCALVRTVFRSGGCFREGTLIMNGEKQWVPVESLGKGDWVWNPLRKKAQRIKKAVQGPEKLPLIRLSTSRGDLDVTTQHTFFTDEGLVTAQEIYERGIKSVRLGGATLEGLSSISIGPEEKVWNFELEGSVVHSDHAIFANGVVTGDLFLQLLPKEKR